MRRFLWYGFGYVLVIVLMLSVYVVAPPTSHADDLTVTGAVSPKPSDMDFAIAGSPTVDTTLHETDTVTVTITYRSNLAGSEDFRIQGYWEKGLIQGSLNNYVDAFNYVVGSATTSDDGTVPTVDLLNRTITWDIANLAPSAEYHTVSFSLRVPDSLPTLLLLNTPVHAQGRIIDTLLPVETLTYVVQGIIEPTATPTATPNPTATPIPSNEQATTVTASPTATPTPTAVDPFTIDLVAIRSISDTTATIVFTTSEPTTFKVQFGSSSNTLSQEMSGTVLRTSHVVELKDLIGGTEYMFRILATNNRGLTVRSDLFTLSTAQQNDIVSIVKKDVSIMWKQVPVSQEEFDTIVLPYQEPITTSIRIASSQNIAFILMRFQNTRILGVSSSDILPAVEEVRLVEVVPGTFAGELAAPRTDGEYQLIIEIHTINGGIETKIMPYQIYVSPPFRVFDKATGNGVENATVNIERYVTNQRQFVQLERSFALENQTDEQGELRLALPSGRYRINISAAGYKPGSEIFDLGQKHRMYPNIGLTASFAFVDRVNYYASAVSGTTGYLLKVTGNFFSSQIAKEATFTLLTIAAICLSLVILGIRMNVSVFGILYFPVTMLIRLLMKVDKNKYCVMHISEHRPFGKRIAGASVLLISHTGKLLLKKSSDPRGSIQVPRKILENSVFPIKIFIYRPGYYAYPVVLDRSAFDDNRIDLVMDREKVEIRSLTTFLGWFVYETRFVISDIMMVFTLFLVVLFTYFHGILRALPLLGVTFILCFVWGVYVVHRFEREVSDHA